MNKLKAFATLLLSAIGIFGAREFYKPRNIKDLLKWRGVKLSSDERVWDSMFFENQKELKDMKIESATDLWGWCNEKFKVTNLSDEIFNETKKFCSDNPTTIMARVIREGEKDRLVKKGQSDPYKINYLLATNKMEVLDLMGLREPIALEKVAENLEQWCDKQQTVRVVKAEDKGKISDFKKRCYDIKVTSYKDLLEKQGRVLMTKTDDFKRRFNEENLKHSKELKAEIKTLLKTRKTQLQSLIRGSKEYLKKELNLDDEDVLINEEGWRLYQTWCLERFNHSLLKHNTQFNNLENYNKFSFRCSLEK